MLFTDDESELPKFELHGAAFDGNLEWIADCLNRGFDVNLKDRDGYTPLQWNAWRGRVGDERSEITKLLIESGADVNTQNNYDDTPLIGACAAGNVDMIRQLLEAGAKVNFNPNYTTALIEAIEYRCLDCVKLLIKYGEDINAELINGQTALKTAIYYEWDEIADYLKEVIAEKNG